MTHDSKVLGVLRSAAVHLPPGDLAAQLGVSLEGIESALRRLSGAGFEIESRPGLGVKLISSPDRLIADDLHARLGVSALAREILVFEETTSTNDVAVNLGRDGHPGAVVFAERQTAGRGRFGRRWDSEAHAGLWCSILIRPVVPMEQWGRLTTWAGVAVASAVERVAPVHAQIKWPNDVLVGGRKIAGILIEGVVDREGAQFAVVGIGLNVNQSEFPSELREKAGSLRMAAGRVLDRAEVAVAVLRGLDASLAAVSDDFAALLAEATRRSALIGGWVTLNSGNDMIAGIAESLDDSGSLMLRTADGHLRRVTAGEVTSQPPVSVPRP